MGGSSGSWPADTGEDGCDDPVAEGEQRGQGADGRSGLGPALLLSAGVTLLAEGAVVAHRASTSGGQQW